MPNPSRVEDPDPGITSPKENPVLSAAAFWLFVATLAWAPFPLGSNRPWSCNLLILAIAACWMVWAASVWRAPHQQLASVKRLTIPILLFAAAILWAVVQTVHFVPPAWVHPVWGIAASDLRTPIDGTISLSPWRTATNVALICSCGLAGWLSFAFAQNGAQRNLLLNAIVIIGASYAAYAFVCASLGFVQFSLFYASPPVGQTMAGPFVNRNSAATYFGLATLCAGARMVEIGSQTVVAKRGMRNFALTFFAFLFGRGTPALLAALLCFSAVIATGSRAGFFATFAGISILILLAGAIAVRQKASPWAFAAGLALVAALLWLLNINGAGLADRFNDMAGTNGADDGRVFLWQAALRMISDAPWLGLGLGTFENAYPLYAEHSLPFVADKAHNDYLELAAGLGLPAAVALVSALLILALRCYRGIFARHRNQIYPMLGFAASILVGVHSAFDFSLQIPAIALTYAVILGLGVGQSFSTHQ